MNERVNWKNGITSNHCLSRLREPVGKNRVLLQDRALNREKKRERERERENERGE